jgi:pimeloyl-ACP methyl ester carboxylesterase
MHATLPPTLLADRILDLPDGRRLAWAEWGAADGPPVVLLHRAPGSRLFDPDPSATEAAGVRLVTVDRPGYGGTDPVAAPTAAAVAPDVKALADHLGLDRYALAGWSGGGRFALEVAAADAGRVTSVSLLCTPASDDDVPWVDESVRSLIDVVRADPVAAVPVATEAFQWFAENAEAMAAADQNPADDAVRARPGVYDALLAMMREAFRGGTAGMVFDVVAGSRLDPIPFEAVSAPVRLWYGDADPIGPEHGRWYADRLAGASLTVVPGAGHLLPVAHWADILAAALT